jgi:TrwC relaxase
MHHGCVRSRQRRREGSGGVVADIAKLSVGREEYYTRELATDHEAYLSGHGESPGRWYGAAANGLGLEGEASVAGFQAMFEGRHPTTGELLGRPHGRNAVPAFDVVLRPTKSVSAAHPSAGADQQAMVRDVCQGGKGLRWWWGGLGPARPSPLGSLGMPGSWTVTGCWPRPRLGSPP